VGAEVGDVIRAGQSTSSNKTTNLKGNAEFQNFKVTNTRAVGVAARFVVKPGNPPFHVSSGVTVPKLNADRVDGVHAAGLLKKKDYDVDKNLVVDDAESLGGVEAADFVQKTGSWSCAGTGWQPVGSDMDYFAVNSMRHRTSTNGNGMFRCSVTVPDGVTMASVTYALHDTNAASNVNSCSLWRTGMTGSPGGETNLAPSVATSGTPGATTLTSAVTNGLVDNSAYSYFVQCNPGAGDSTTGIYGATINYSANGAGAAPGGKADVGSSLEE
jgi:hypothetical protein